MLRRIAPGIALVRRRSDSSCTATGHALGLTIDLDNLGGGDPCTKRFGLFQRAVARAPLWRTSAGLKVGDPVARLRHLYPAARLHRGLRLYWPSGWSLSRARTPNGTGGTYPGLLAETRAGRVVGFHVRYQSGGDRALTWTGRAFWRRRNLRLDSEL